MSTRTLIDATPDDVVVRPSGTTWYYGATMAKAARLPVGAIYGVVASRWKPETPGHHSANRWTYTRFKIVKNRRGRWHQVESQRVLTEEEIAHFEARMAAEFR